MYYKMAQLVLRGAEKKTGTTSEIYIAQPDSEKEDLVGKLFVLVEIDSKAAGYIKLVNFIIDTLEHNFYFGERTVLRERVKTIKVEQVFESALAKTNKSLIDFSRAEGIKIEAEKMNIIAGVAFENEIHFTSAGKNKAFLIFKEKDKKINSRNKIQTQEEKKFKLVNVTEQAEGEEKREVNPAKLFASVISGNLPFGGYFVFANEAFSEYLSPKQLIEIVTTLPPASAVEQIKNILLRINAYVSFLGVIIKNTSGFAEPEKKKEKFIPASSTRESISNLQSLEEKTEKILSPGGYVNFKKGLGKISGALNIKTPNLRLGKGGFSGSGILKDKIVFKKKPAFNFLKTFISVLRDLFSYAVNFFTFVFKTAGDKEKMAGIANEASSRIKSFFVDLKSKFLQFIFWFKNLNKKGKVLLVIILLSLVLFTQNLIATNIKNKKIKAETALANSVSEITQTEDQIEADLLYNNEDTAKASLAEVKTLLAELPQDNTGKYKSLFDKYNTEMAQISHVVKLGNLTEVANFTKLDPNANPDNLIMDNAKIYAADSVAKSLYIVNTTNDSISSKNLSNAVNLKFPFIDNNGNIDYYNGAYFISFDPKSKSVSDLKADLSNYDIAGISDYNGSLYVLDKKSDQIYKFRKTVSGFSEIASWMKDPVNLNNASSMDIDGNIFVAENNGTVLKFTRGREENFQLDSVNPKIDTPIKIYADNLNFIYILEPAKNRLAVFTKDGKYVEQFQSDQFTNLKDCVIDEKNKTIYFLNGPTILKAQIQLPMK